jgi:hypothetical protein
MPCWAGFRESDLIVVGLKALVALSLIWILRPPLSSRKVEHIHTPLIPARRLASGVRYRVEVRRGRPAITSIWPPGALGTLGRLIRDN